MHLATATIGCTVVHELLLSNLPLVLAFSSCIQDSPGAHSSLPVTANYLPAKLSWKGRINMCSFF
jgi:hypothetical protein